MNKQGIFYLFIGAILASATLAFYFIASQSPFSVSKEAVESRVTTMDDFLDSLDRDLAKATRIAGFRALIAMEEAVTTRGSYFNDSETVFREAFFNGTIDGRNRTILNTSSMSDYAARVNQSAADIGAVLNLSVKDVTLFQDDPWHISVTVDYSTHLVDESGLAGWSYERSVTEEVPIWSLRDPAYGVETGGKVSNTIRETNVTRFINDTDDANDTSPLVFHTNQSFYIASDEAPSYLMRFEGNFTESEHGIESLVDIPELDSQGVAVKNDRSLVDHNYFGNGTNGTVCTQIINSPSWFKLDSNHVERYELDPKLEPDGYQC